MNVLITDFITNPNIEKKILGDYLKKNFNKNIEILIVWHQLCNEVYLKKLPFLKLIVRYGVGYDNIDLNYLKKNKIHLVNNPDYGVDEVSDTAIAFLMAYTRKIFSYNQSLLSEKIFDKSWQEKRIKSIKRSSEIKVGSIGAGRIGSAFLLKAKKLNFKTFFYDPFIKNGYDKVISSSRVNEISTLFKVCDVVSIHCPYNKNTKNIVDKDLLELTKNKNFLLINTARGGIINEMHLAEYLKKNKNFNASLDVIKEEPPSANDSLIKFWKSDIDHRLLINPHTAFYSTSSFKEMRIKAALLALKYIKYKTLDNKII